VLHEPKPRPKWYGGVASDRWGTDFADPELQTHRVLVNEWFATALPAGHYKLLVLLDRIELGFNARNDLYPVDKRWELPFEILPPDDKAVSKMYEALLADCK